MTTSGARDEDQKISMHHNELQIEKLCQCRLINDFSDNAIHEQTKRAPPEWVGRVFLLNILAGIAEGVCEYLKRIRLSN